MTNQPPDDYLTSLLGRLLVGWENEVVEFKEAGDGFSTSKIGEYFSALSNEANLRGEAAGWLVFGVSNRTREVVGTVYRPERDRLQSLKMQIANGTEPSSTFREIHELDHPSGRVLLMEIPAAPRGIPIAWNGHYYARAGESLTSLALDKLDEIRGQTLEDWSAVVVPDATLADLDPAALSRAREAIEKKFTNRSRGVDVTDWPIETLLDRA